MPCLPPSITTSTCYYHHEKPIIMLWMAWRGTFSLPALCTFWVHCTYTQSPLTPPSIHHLWHLGRMTEAVAHYRHVLRLASTAGRGSVDEDRLDGWRAEAEVGLRLAARHLAATCRQNYGSCNSVDDLLSQH